MTLFILRGRAFHGDTGRTRREGKVPWSGWKEDGKAKDIGKECPGMVDLNVGNFSTTHTANNRRRRYVTVLLN